jgi:hypothetical protein
MVPRYCLATGEVFFQYFSGNSGGRIWKATFKEIQD